MPNPRLTIGDQAIAKYRPDVEMARKHTFSENHHGVSESRKIAILWPEIQIANDRKRDVDDHEEHQEMRNVDESRWTGETLKSEREGGWPGREGDGERVWGK
jgi:hypothetical protein